MSIYTRLKQPNQPDGTAVIPNHAWTAAIQELAMGNVTKPVVVATFALDAQESAELDTYGAKWATLGTLQDKVFWLNSVNNMGQLLEIGIITPEVYKMQLGVS